VDVGRAERERIRQDSEELLNLFVFPCLALFQKIVEGLDLCYVLRVSAEAWRY